MPGPVPGVRSKGPLRRRLFCGGCSWVEYQRIIFWHGCCGLCPGASTAPVSLFLGGVGVWKVAGVWGAGVVFGALLGPEATGPLLVAGFPGFLWGAGCWWWFWVFLVSWLQRSHARLCVWGVWFGVVV